MSRRARNRPWSQPPWDLRLAALEQLDPAAGQQIDHLADLGDLLRIPSDPGRGQDRLEAGQELPDFGFGRDDDGSGPGGLQGLDLGIQLGVPATELSDMDRGLLAVRVGVAEIVHDELDLPPECLGAGFQARQAFRVGPLEVLGRAATGVDDRLDELRILADELGEGPAGQLQGQRTRQEGEQRPLVSR